MNKLDDIMGERLSVLTNTKFIKYDDVKVGMKILIRPITIGHSDLETKTPIQYRGKVAVINNKMDNGVIVSIDGHKKRKIVDYIDINYVD